MTWFDKLADKILRIAGIDNSTIEAPRFKSQGKLSLPLGRISKGDDGREADHYRPYTTDFDLACNAAEVPFVPNDQALIAEPLPPPTEFEVAATGEWLTTYKASAAWCGIQVSLLIDHSGSMRNGGMLNAVAAARVFAQVMGGVGAQFEVLGFTTRSWKGGRSRLKWLAAGRPPNPGRLCDLLHIIYHPSPAGNAVGHWGLMLNPQLLRENVDGEAVQWAIGRLKPGTGTRKVLIILTDGVPGDDSTLASNGEHLLPSHLRDVLAENARTGEVQIEAVQVAQQSSPSLYPNVRVALDPEAAQRAILGILAGLTTEP